MIVTLLHLSWQLNLTNSSGYSTSSLNSSACYSQTLLKQTLRGHAYLFLICNREIVITVKVYVVKVSFGTRKVELYLFVIAVKFIITVIIITKFDCSLFENLNRTSEMKSVYSKAMRSENLIEYSIKIRVESNISRIFRTD